MSGSQEALDIFGSIDKIDFAGVRFDGTDSSGNPYVIDSKKSPCFDLNNLGVLDLFSFLIEPSATGGTSELSRYSIEICKVSPDILNLSKSNILEYSGYDLYSDKTLDKNLSTAPDSDGAAPYRVSLNSLKIENVSSKDFLHELLKTDIFLDNSKIKVSAAENQYFKLENFDEILESSRNKIKTFDKLDFSDLSVSRSKSLEISLTASEDDLRMFLLEGTKNFYKNFIDQKEFLVTNITDMLSEILESRRSPCEFGVRLYRRKAILQVLFQGFSVEGL